MKMLIHVVCTLLYTTLFSLMDMWLNHWEWKRENAAIFFAIATTISIIITKDKEEEK